MSCAVCTRFEASIRGLKNLSDAWISGSNNHRTSNIVDHAKSEQHKASMMRLRADQAKSKQLSITSYSPIARCLLRMDQTSKERMCKKFDICYVMTKENMAFRKYPVLHELEIRRGVDLGPAYRTKDSAKNFIHYIAEAQRHTFMEDLPSVHFFSFLMDGSVDVGKVEDELIVILYCMKDNSSEEIWSCTRFFSVQAPSRADAAGLIECLGGALKKLGIDDLLDQAKVLGVEGKPVLVGGGTDGASVNISEQNGMRGTMQRALPWLFWGWCYAHRLELACKDSLSSKLFKDIQEMLLRLYYLYEKSAKKSRELLDIVEDLREVYDFSQGGDLPVRAQGSRWITYKRRALQRVIDQFGAYLSHLSTLAQDKSTKSDDKARLVGYIRNWSQSRILVGCALYVDILKPPSLLSLTLQHDKLDLVLGIKHILKTIKSLKALASQDPLQWPTVKLVCSRIKDEDGSKQYQGALLHCYNTRTLECCKEQALADLKQLDLKMRDRLKWSDVKLLRSILLFIDTQGWQVKSSSTNTGMSDSDGGEEDNLDGIKSALESITSAFRAPLEAKEVNLSSLHDEIEEVVDHARRYLSIDKVCYQTVWYKLHTSPDTSKWPNILLICQLLFSLPFSSGRVERIFSTLKVIKTDRQTRLHTSTLCDLLDISVENPELSDFSSDRVIEMWWKDCATTRRVNQSARREYRPRQSTSGATSFSTTGEEDVEELALDDWDKWFENDEELDNSEFDLEMLN